MFSVKKGMLPLCWVSSPEYFDCRSNALPSELRRFHKTFLTESVDIRGQIGVNRFCEKSFVEPP